MKVKEKRRKIAWGITGSGEKIMEKKKYEIREQRDPLGIFGTRKVGEIKPVTEDRSIITENRGPFGILGQKKTGEMRRDKDGTIRITENRGPFGIFGQRTKTIYREK